MKTLLSIATALLLIGCGTTQEVQKPAWIPKKGERVATNYNYEAPNHIGNPQIVTVTRARKNAAGKYVVYTKEIPHAIPLDMVTAW